MSGSSETATALTREWVSRLVVGEGLCPFASPVLDALLIETSLSDDDRVLTAEFMTLLERMADADPVQCPTALFVAPNAFASFDEYWNWTLICDSLLVQLGYEGVFQLATFHPQYLFDGEDDEGMSHFTNRSPYPMLHIIREADMDEALAQVRYPERIPERNRAHMARLGKTGLLAIMPSLADTAVFNQEDTSGD